MKKTFFIVALLISFVSFSQQKKIDSLLYDIETAQDDFQKIEKLNELARFYIYYSPVDAIDYINKALSLSEQKSSIKGKIISQINLGFYYIRVDNYKKSKKILREALKYSKQLNENVLCGEVSYLMARANNGIGRYDFSMNKLIIAEKFYDSAQFNKYRGRVYETMGDLNDKFGNYELAIENLQKSLELKIKHNDIMELSRTYAYLGNVYLHQNLDAIALNYYKKGLNSSIKSYNLNSQAYCLTKLGEFYLAKKEYSKSKSFFEKSLEIANKHNNNWSKFRNEIGLSKADFELKNYKKALEMCLNAIQIAKAINDEEGLMHGYKLLSNVYEKTDDIKNAYESFKLFSLFEEKLFDKEKTAEITMAETSFKNTQKINNLNKEKKAKENELKLYQIKEKNRRLVGGILIGSLIIVIIFAWFQYKRYLAIKKQKAIIQKQTQENLLLIKNFSVQERLSTVGEISSGIAHELNSPLGTVKSSAEGIQFIFDKLLKNKAWDCPTEEIDFVVSYLSDKTFETRITGKSRLKEEKWFFNYLDENYNKLKTKEKLSKLFVQAQINPKDIDTIEYILKSKSPINLLEFIKSSTGILFFINANLTSTKRLSEKVSELREYLIYDKTEAKVKTNLKKNITTIVNLYRHEIEPDIQFSIDVDDHIEMSAYPTKLYQVWSNLIKNAIDAVNKNEGTKQVKIQVNVNNGISVEFKNNGPKINKSQHDQIFENLYTTKDRGAGLGLGIVKNVVETHRGEIGLTSDDNETTFTVYFKPE